MGTCKVCEIRPAINPGSTCGNSYCQETAYYLNMARNSRGLVKQLAQAKADHARKEASRDE